MDKTLSSLPKYERKSDVVINILKAFSFEKNLLEVNINDIAAQLDIDLATWGLDIYEKEFGLEKNYNLDLKLRRELIKTKMNMQPPATKVQMADMLRNLIDAEIKENFSKYEFEVWIKYEKDIFNKLPHIEEMIEEFKSAHLNFLFNIINSRQTVIREKVTYGSTIIPICNTLKCGQYPRTSRLVHKIKSSKIKEKFEYRTTKYLVSGCIVSKE